jgi:5-methylcytosine-specific restriction enzyme subunit McrC
MPESESTLLRLCEYQSRVVTWSRDTREAVVAAAEAWAQAHRLASSPLSFEGSDGCTLRAQQFVGVVEAGGVRVEIYPKLDAALVRDSNVDEQRARTVMANLLWMLEVSGYDGLVDAGDASVEDSPESITDLLAWLFARRLRDQLAVGVPNEYLSMRDDLPFKRGRIQFARQATNLFGRPDILACEWDEFSPDTPLTRLLRCATEVLLSRVRLPGASADLRDALAMLDDAQSVHPLEALHRSTQIRWSRLNARWRPCHDLAQAVLRGLGRELHAGGTESFVFLLDMNELFESFCTRWLERRFQVPVRTQEFVGRLLKREQRALYQYADFLWRDRENELWVGDAKYKLGDREDWPKIDDTRQLICYGQLAAQRHDTQPGSLMLLYPTTGEETEEVVTTFDDQELSLQAVRVVRRG